MAEIQQFISKEAQKQIDKYIQDITKLSTQYSNIAKTSQEVTDQQKKQASTQKDLDDTTKQYNNLLGQLNTASGKLAVSESNLNKEVLKVRQELAEKNKAIKDSIKLENSEEGSINKLRNANKKLRQQRDQLSTSTQEGKDRIAELNAEIDKNSELIKDNVDKRGKQIESIGGYEDAIKSITEAQGLFSGGIGNVIQNFISLSEQEGGLKSFFQQGVKGFGNLTKAAIKFILTPVGAIIAAIVVGITLLSKALSRNQGFMDKFNEVLSGLSAVLDNVLGRVFKLVTALAKIGWAGLTGDVEGVKSAVNDAGEAFTGLGESIKFAFEEGQAIEKLRQDLRKLNIETTIALETLRQEADLQQTIADDSTRSFAEREEAAKKAREANLQAFQTEAELAKRREEIIIRENKLAKENGELTDDLRQQQADATAERIAADGELLKVQMENEKTRRELMQDRLEKDLDILIDGFDNVKTINERIIADDKRTFAEREKTLENTQKLAKSSFDKQIETIKQFTKVAFDENKLLAEQDAIILNEKIRNLDLSEIIEGRLLEIIKERRLAVSDLAQIQKDLNKDLTVINSQSKEWHAEQEQRKSEALISAEEGAKKTFEISSELTLKEQQQAINAAQAKIYLANLVKQNSINAAWDIATAATNLLGQETAAGKVAAITESAISGYVGAQKAFTETPGPVFVKFAAAAAAASFSIKNIAKIISTKTDQPKLTMPAFAEGTGINGTPSGNWLMGEDGRELKIDKKGNAMLVNKPTIFNNEVGSTIFSNPDTEKILRGQKPYKQTTFNDSRIVKAIQDNVPMMGINKYGIITIAKKNTATTKVLNSKWRN